MRGERLFYGTQPRRPAGRRCRDGPVSLMRAGFRLHGPCRSTNQQRFLCVQTVLGLVPHHGLRAVDHFSGDFLAAVGGRQCWKSASGLANAISSVLTW